MRTGNRIIVLKKHAKTRRSVLNVEYQFDQRKGNIIKHINSLSHIKMGKEIVSDIEIEKNKFYHYKRY